MLTTKEVDDVLLSLLGEPTPEYVYAAGRFSHYKGFDNLVSAAARLISKHPHLRFVIAGDGETRKDILRQAHDLGISGHVLCPGRVSDKEYWALMSRCRMFCLPSTERSEAFGVVLLEAMAMGKYCISTCIPGSGTAWVNQNGQTGATIPPGDVSALVEAISQALSLPPEHCVLFGKQRAAMFNAATIAQQFIDVITSRS